MKKQTLEQLSQWFDRIVALSRANMNIGLYSHSLGGERILRALKMCNMSMYKLGAYPSSVLTYRDNHYVYFTIDGEKPFYERSNGDRVYLKPDAKVRYFKDNYPTPISNWKPIKH